MTQRTCAVCNADISHRQLDAIYCGTPCRKWANRNGLTAQSTSSTSRDRTCSQCDTPFTTVNTQQRYCTPKCQRRAESKRRNQRWTDRPTRRDTCERCGNTFEHRQTKRQKYCGHECYRLAATTIACQDCGTVVPPDQRRGHSSTPRCLDCHKTWKRAAIASPRQAERQWHDVLRADPCSYCGKPSATIDHVVPQARGGTNTTDNLTGCCRDCNALKNTLPLLPFLLYRQLHAAVTELEQERRWIWNTTSVAA